MTKDIERVAEAINIAKATVGDAIERLRLFRDEPCDIPDIQHVAAIGVEALERSHKKLAAIEAMQQEPDITKCPGCGGVADNGFDRCFPPNPYYCTKCEKPEPDENGLLPEIMETLEFYADPQGYIYSDIEDDKGQKAYTLLCKLRKAWNRRGK